MIKAKELLTEQDFIDLKKGDVVACEFHRDMHDYPKSYRFKVFEIFENKTRTEEIILQKEEQYLFQLSDVSKRRKQLEISNINFTH